MTPRMTEFLNHAATAEPGKGVLVEREDKRIAGMATSQDFGWQIVGPLPIFIINDKARAVLDKIGEGGA